MTCAACGEQTPVGGRFCIQCGTPTQDSCPSCGEPVIHGARFCAECGTPLGGARPSAPSAQATVSERRLVSVMFVDLVGFTTISEHRDPEEVRELLSRYFERCTRTIKRYGGSIEKFIGDAVCCVWGTPVAREDDAERAVRAGLAITHAVSSLGEEIGIPQLRARVGVLTGMAAVKIGDEAEAMVHGDAVTTASALQALAAPGTVLVDEATHRASEAAIAYESYGNHEVKGRREPIHTWTALRVVAGTGGALRGVGLEAPFVGRDRELQLIIGSLESIVSNRHAALVTVVGEAGLGKSRLLWEFFKYADGVDEEAWWHQGRCLSYGTGLAFWALAEMVRVRAGIGEEEDHVTARRKLRAVIEQHVADERECRLVEPRLAHLLGLEQRTSADRADLFSGWRLFFERMAETRPVILAFEDLEWADSGLLEFIDYLLEWSSEFPILVLGAGRTELLDARPAWVPTVRLGPLDDAAMSELLHGLVPGLPEDLSAQIRRRAEGVPLYAVETVRMLLDRGLIAQEGARYVVTGDVSDLEVPETLQSLAAARLDNLDPTERSLLQDAAVIGQAFTPAALTAVSGLPAAEVHRLLESLVRKQVLSYVTDTRSSERGNYVFLQTLLRQVAVGTLSRRDRKARHLAIARHLRQTWGDEGGEYAEVLASHYLDAVAADPEAPDVAELRAAALETLTDAGRRALSMAIGPEARRHFERASELALGSAERGQLLREAGVAAQLGGELEDALSLLTRASEALMVASLEREVASTESLVGKVLLELGRLEEAAERLERAHGAIKDGGEDEVFADLAERRAEVAFMRARMDEALVLVEPALRIADGRRLGRILVRGLTTKSNALAQSARPVEATALMTHAVQMALEQDLPAEAATSYFNLADFMMSEARFTEGAELLDRGLVLVRRRGDRQGERRLLALLVCAFIALGQWDEAVELVGQLRERADDIWTAVVVTMMPLILSPRGDVQGLLDLRNGSWGKFTDWSEAAVGYKFADAIIARDSGQPEEALDDALWAAKQLIGRFVSQVPFVFAEAVECAFAANRPEVVAELIHDADRLTPAELIPLLEAEVIRARARLAAHRGEAEKAEQWFRRATHLFRELATHFYLARAQLEHAELLRTLNADPTETERLRDEAAAVFEELGATPWLERARPGRLALVSQRPVLGGASSPLAVGPPAGEPV
jgi:predicted ATPase/class 3 adenylate cyclase